MSYSQGEKASLGNNFGGDRRGGFKTLATAGSFAACCAARLPNANPPDITEAVNQNAHYASIQSEDSHPTGRNPSLGRITKSFQNSVAKRLASVA